MQKLSKSEKEIVERLNHPTYTVDFLEEWINRNDLVMVNAPAALQAMAAKGYYSAVKQFADNVKKEIG